MCAFYCFRKMNMLFVFFSIARIIMLFYFKRNQELYICLINDYQTGWWGFISLKRPNISRVRNVIFVKSL